MARRRLPPNSTLTRWVAEGLTHQQIADRVKEETGETVTRAAVTLALGRAGVGSQPNQKKYAEELPWTVRKHHSQQYPARMLRLLGKQRHPGKRLLTAEEERRLQRWLLWLAENTAVVAYNPTRGFLYVKADEVGDGKVDGVPVRQRVIDDRELPEV